MASGPNKMVAALASLSQETTFALLNLPFDFAFIKFEAPEQYSEVGLHLSKQRREAAEQGAEHVIARKLGALFSQSLPPAPKLIEKYGLRCSEILKASSIAEKSSNVKNLFQDWVGADATSIWAAATSGREAIAVHLLACMLARTYTAPEAVAIWEELIKHQKTKLREADGSSAMSIAAIGAAQIEVTRDQISRWDASARAWLRIADGIKKKEQTQLVLLMSDLSWPVAAGRSLHDSVMSAWVTAMKIVESILNGTSQSILDGAGFVALASWHLYPNIYALQAERKEVNFNDPLVPSGVHITLGAAHSSPDHEPGIHWSLPLACLRYYGDPVPASGTLAVTTGRLSMHECLFVSLGVIFSTWGEIATDFDLACKLVIKLEQYLSVYERMLDDENMSGDECVAETGPLAKSVYNWLEHLSETAQTYLSSKGTEREWYHKLMAGGQRRYPRFLSNVEKHPLPVFGLVSIRTLVALINDTDHKVLALRHFAQRHIDRHAKVLIRYKGPFGEHLRGAGINWSYASVFESAAPTDRKRKFDEEEQAMRHTRWTTSSRQRRDGERVCVCKDGWSNVHSFDSFQWTEDDQRETYFCIAGNYQDAAIFAPGVEGAPPSSDATAPAELILEAFESKWIDEDLLCTHLNRLGVDSALSDDYIRALRSLAAAANLYESMPGATISTGIFTRPLANAAWAACLVTEQSQRIGLLRDIMGPEISTFALSRKGAMSCIANFENVEIDLDPQELSDVMALSCGNSIYVSSVLLCDPSKIGLDDDIKHIVGNIGQPGLNLLVPPPKPKTRVDDGGSWTLINHAPFDGRFENSFQHTSLHLTFTGDRFPIRGASRGQLTVDAFYVESVVSVFDRSVWVADLDILTALSNPCLQRVRTPCNHAQSRWPTPLISLDSWEEYLDRPLQPTIFRSKGNWLARLAVVAHNAFLDRPTCLFEIGKAVCWECASTWLSKTTKDAADRNMLPMFVC